MVIDNLRVPRGAFAPIETYPPLIVDADAILTPPIAVQSFEPIARRNGQIVELFCRVKGEQFRSRPTLNLMR